MSPNTIESAPPAISSHSSLISLRNWMAPTICSKPVAIAQQAMNTSSTTAVSPGHRNVMVPAAMPSKPTTASHQRGDGVLPVIAAASAKMPSARAKAPYSRTSVKRVTPGQMKVRTPNRIVQIPRNRMSHQFLANACSMNRGAKGGCVFADIAMMLLLVCSCGIDAQLSAASQHGTSSSEIGDYPGASLRKSRRNRKLDEVRQPCKIGEWHAERVRVILTCGYSLGRRFRDPI